MFDLYLAISNPVRETLEFPLPTDVDLQTFNPFDPATLQCPYPHYAKMRAEEPVLHVPALGMYLACNNALVSEILRDTDTFSSAFGNTSLPLPAADREKIMSVIAEAYPRVPTMLTADPPSHTRLPATGVEGVHAESSERTGTGNPVHCDPTHRQLDRDRAHRVRTPVRGAASR